MNVNYCTHKCGTAKRTMLLVDQTKRLRGRLVEALTPRQRYVGLVTIPTDASPVCSSIA